MSLPAGTRLGRYEVVGLLGAGGMGEVYRATDPQLDRDVAIKVLPQETVADPQALARFHREARIVAALSHPNLLCVYDFGEHDGLTYTVTELLEGETLRGRLKRSPPDWRGAAEIAAAIAEGLAPAHFQGIVHRDLKPENIFLTQFTDGSPGRTVILDFGLARSMPAGVQQEETVLAGAGLAMGTVGVHVSRTGARRGRRQRQRYLFPGLRPLRDACRPSPFSAAYSGGGAGGDLARRSRTATDRPPS